MQSENTQTQTTAQNANVDTANNVEETPSSKAETPDTERPTESEDRQEAEQEQEDQAPESEEETASQEETTESDSTGEAPTRAERRIRNLIDKNKNLKQQIDKLSEPTVDRLKELASKAKEPLINEQEAREGVDPNVLEQRIQKRIQLGVQQAITQQQMTQKWKSQIAEHQTDLERTLEKHPELNEESEDYDEDLAEAFLERYQEANYLPNGRFYPRKKGSEIAERLAKLRERSVAKETAKLQGKMAKTASEGAVAPTQSEGEERDFETEELRERAATTGRDEDWAEYLKKIM